MKKNLLFAILFTAIIGLNATSQSISLYNLSGPLSNNQAVGMPGLPDDPDIVCYLYVKNNTATTISVMMKKVIIDTVPGSINSFCWGANCFPPFVYVSPDPVEILPGTTDSISFSAHYEPLGNSGTSIIRYTFFLRDNVDDTSTMRAYFQAFPVGIEENTTLSVSGVYPNPANEKFTVNYSVPSNGSANLTVRDILGSVKYSAIVSGTGKHVVSASALANGFYFCSLEVNGKTAAAKKVIVKH